MATRTAQHTFMQIIMTPIIVVKMDDGEIITRPDPEGHEEVRFGCTVCNMGVEEAHDLPCPGFDILDDSIFE